MPLSPRRTAAHRDRRRDGAARDASQPRSGEPFSDTRPADKEDGVPPRAVRAGFCVGDLRVLREHPGRGDCGVLRQEAHQCRE